MFKTLLRRSKDGANSWGKPSTDVHTDVRHRGMEKVLVHYQKASEEELDEIELFQKIGCAFVTWSRWKHKTTQPPSNLSPIRFLLQIYIKYLNNSHPSILCQYDSNDLWLQLLASGMSSAWRTPCRSKRHWHCSSHWNTAWTFFLSSFLAVSNRKLSLSTLTIRFWTCLPIQVTRNEGNGTLAKPNTPSWLSIHKANVSSNISCSKLNSNFKTNSRWSDQLVAPFAHSLSFYRVHLII